MSGFQATRSQTSSAYPAPLETFVIPSSENKAIAIGDIVIPLAATSSVGGIQTVARLATAAIPSTTEGIIGIVMGNNIDPDNEVVGIPANSAVDREVRVNIDPYQLYEVTVDNGTSQLILPTVVGLNVQVIAAASIVGSLSTSGMQIDGNVTPVIGGTLPFRLVAITELDATDTFATKVVVRPNLIFTRSVTGAA